MPPLTPPAFQLGPAIPQYNGPQGYYSSGQPAALGGNPISVAVADRDFAWDQIVDIVDDYFKIDREQRVTPDLLAEGRIETFPQVSPTIFEPFRRDSATTGDRWENTLQTIRRTAMVRVMNDANGFLVEVQVLKELENLERPAHATAGAATFRHDTSPDRNTEAEPTLGRDSNNDPRPVSNPRRTLGWISQGRDSALEQLILSRIQDRLNTTTAAIGTGILAPQNNPGNVFSAPPLSNGPGLIEPNGSVTIPGLPPNNAHIGLPPDAK